MISLSKIAEQVADEYLPFQDRDNVARNAAVHLSVSSKLGVVSPSS